MEVLAVSFMYQEVFRTPKERSDLCSDRGRCPMNLSDAGLAKSHLVRKGLNRKGLNRKGMRCSYQFTDASTKAWETIPKLEKERWEPPFNGLGREKMEKKPDQLERKQASAGSNNPGLFMILDII